MNIADLNISFSYLVSTLKTASAQFLAFLDKYDLSENRPLDPETLNKFRKIQSVFQNLIPVLNAADSLGTGDPKYGEDNFRVVYAKFTGALDAFPMANTPLIKCEACDTITRLPHEPIPGTNVTWCSPECYDIIHSRRANAITKAKRKRENEKLERYCKQCGKKFNPERKDNIFCSIQCRKEYHNILQFERNRNVFRAYTLKGKICKQCGKPIEGDRQGKKVFCSEECRKIFYKEYQKSYQRLYRAEKDL